MVKIAINHIPIRSTLKSDAKSKGIIRKKDQQIAKNEPGESHDPVTLRVNKAEVSIVINGNINMINQYFDFTMASEE